MTTAVVRRLYLYAAALLGLQVLAAGARGLLTSALEPLVVAAPLGDAAATAFRLSLNIALIVVGLPLWALHWWLAQRAARDPDEQRARLRRLYAYLVLAIAMLGGLIALASLLGTLLAGVAAAGADAQVAAAIGALIVHGAVGAYHWRVFSADRALVEQAGGTATLRRWYLVVALAASLAVASIAAINLLRDLVLRAASITLGDTPGLALALGPMIAGLVFWLPHQLWWRRLVRVPSPLHDDEARSVLRQVYTALVITITVVATLGGLTSLLYYLLMAAFGGAAWPGLLADQAQPLAIVLVAAPLWLYHRAQLGHEARLSALPARMAIARRLIGYLTAAVGLVALFFGLGGLLGTLLRLALAPAMLGTGWREPLSIYLALTTIALPVYGSTAYALERLAGTALNEARALARRIYLYAALLFGIGATITALVQLLRLALGVLLGAQADGVAAEIGRWLGYTLIGAAIVAYHALLVRRAGTARAGLGAGLSIAVIAAEPLRQALLAAIAREAPGATIRLLDTAGDPAADRLQGADLVIAPLAEALSAPGAQAIHAFAGRRLLLATATPGYELIGARHGDEALTRELARTLRATLGDAPADAR